MKKYLSGLLLLLLLSMNGHAQRISLTKTANTVEALQEESQDMADQLQTVEQRLDEVTVHIDTLFKQGKKVVKVPTTVDEANSLYVYVSSIIMFILVGVFKNKLPPWLTPFMQSIIIALIITAIAYFGSSGAFTISEALTFFIGISGGSNILHQIKKPSTLLQKA